MSLLTLRQLNAEKATRFNCAGDHDDRVSPLHSLKLLAELQHSLTSSPGAKQRNPLVSRIEVRTGHGAGKPTEKVIAEAADMFAFAAHATGCDWRS